LISTISPNDAHDREFLNNKTFKKWVKKFNLYFSEEVLNNLIKMYKRKEKNSLMCSSYFSSNYGTFDSFFYDPLSFKYSSHTT
jgi:hypothetical protein